MIKCLSILYQFRFQRNIKGIWKEWNGIPKKWNGIPKKWNGIPKKWNGIPKQWNGIPKQWNGIPKKWNGIPKEWNDSNRNSTPLIKLQRSEIVSTEKSEIVATQNMNKPFKTASYRTFIFLYETYCLIEINIPSQFYLDYQENLL